MLREEQDQVKHECELPESEDIVVKYIRHGYFIKWRRKFRHWFLASNTGYASRIYLRSAYQIRREREYHLKYHYYMIHPYSQFRKFWQVVMMLTFFLFCLLIPIGNIFETDHNWPLFNTLLDTICMVDVVLNFFTGFQNPKNNIVVLDSKLVAKNYLLGWFTIDFISSFYYSSFYHLFGKTFDGNSAKFLVYTTVLKTFRSFTLYRYLIGLEYVLKFSKNTIRFIKLFQMSLLLVLRIFSVTTLASGQKLHIEDMKEVAVAARKVVYFLFLFGIPAKSENLLQTLGNLFCLCCGFVYQIYIIMLLMEISASKFAATKRFTYKRLQLYEFMKCKGLPLDLQERIGHYININFVQHLCNEKEILHILTPQLRKELLIHKHMEMLQSASAFQLLPAVVLTKFIYLMRTEIYLPGDVITQVGNYTDCMHFIENGTVALYAASGQEICHKSDGAHFGESALLLEQQTADYTAISLDHCEISILQRSDVERVFERYPELYQRVKMHVLSMRRQRALNKAYDSAAAALR